jgi:hypothetical protein
VPALVRDRSFEPSSPTLTFVKPQRAQPGPVCASARWTRVALAGLFFQRPAIDSDGLLLDPSAATLALA